MLRLAIRLIFKPILDSLFILTRAKLLIPPLILPPHILSQAQRNNKHPAIARDQTVQRREIPRALTCKEDIRTCDIARGVEDEPQPVGSAALSVPRDVAREQIPRQDHRRADNVLQPRAADEAPALRQRRKTDPEQACERRQADECQDDASRVFEVTRC